MSAKKTSKSGAGMTSMKKTSRSSAAGASAKTASVSARSDEEGNHGILEGISSLHSWIKTQTMIRPAKLGGVKREGAGFEEEDEDDDIVISLTSKDPNVSTTQVRYAIDIVDNYM